mmetsp:Transcript_155/g.586  ORF Transcript_155/g.586 Transcript_155/m.586 type:complete len:441 (-) Transcript_155:325-1647(-)
MSVVVLHPPCVSVARRESRANLELLEQLRRIRGRVVLHNLLRVAALDDVHVLLQLRPRRRLERLHRRQPAAGDEIVPPLGIVRQHFADLVHDKLDNLVRQSPLLQGPIQRGEVGELLDDEPQRPDALRPQILRRARKRTHRDELGEHARVGDGFGVVGRVPANLPQAPRARALDVVLGLLHERREERRDALARDHRRRQRLAERADVPQRHDARQAIVPLGLVHVIDQRGDAAVGHDELRELGRVLANLADRRRGVLAHEPVDVLEAHEDAREYLRLDDNLREIDRVLRNLTERRAHLPLELGIRREDERGEVRDRSRVHDSLRHLRGVLRDVRERRRGDALERELGFLDAEHQERHRARLHDAAGEVGVVSRDVPEGPRGGFLDARVELLEALHQRVEGAAVHHGLRERGRVLGHRPQDKRRSLLVKSVLLAERVDELG